MLNRAAHELGIDLSSSWMIGDKVADINAGIAAGCQTVLVKTGYGEAEAASLPKGVAVMADFRAAAAHIIKIIKG
jgi:D-glycero-D-manno-heptose 1,7-bisphosphate phosphatase